MATLTLPPGYARRCFNRDRTERDRVLRTARRLDPLILLRSDYNVLLSDRIWDEARQHPLRETVELAATRAARPIATAGLILAV